METVLLDLRSGVLGRSETIVLLGDKLRALRRRWAKQRSPVGLSIHERCRTTGCYDRGPNYRLARTVCPP